MASLVSQYESASIYYAVLGKSASTSTIDYFAQQLQLGNKTDLQFINGLIASADGVARFGAKTPAEVIQTIYTNVHGVAPSTEVVNALLATGNSVGVIVQSIINDLSNYAGNDSATLSQQSFSMEK